MLQRDVQRRSPCEEPSCATNELEVTVHEEVKSGWRQLQFECS